MPGDAAPVSEPAAITRLLEAWRGGDGDALERLTPLVYAELRRLAARCLKGERPGHTWQPTELVHEAFVRLIRGETPDFRDRAHFLAISAWQMRQILVDHARRRNRGKRGGGAAPVAMEDCDAAAPERSTDVLALHEALDAFAALDARKSRILEMLFFGGMTMEEIAVALELHVNTVARDARLARAWLHRRLSERAGR
jgi:RNA polymerase sigma factor (TIGR02999 family)